GTAVPPLSETVNRPVNSPDEPNVTLSPGGGRLVRAQLRGAYARASAGLARDPLRPTRADRRAHGVGQDTGSLSRRHRFAGPARSEGRTARRDANRLRVAAEGAVQRHPAQFGGTAS